LAMEWRPLPLEKVPVGALTIDMFDSSNKQLIFRGSSSHTLSDKPEKNERKLDKSVPDMIHQQSLPGYPVERKPFSATLCKIRRSARPAQSVADNCTRPK
jgi:hypothetical protein